MIRSCSKHDNKFVSLLFFMYNITDTLGKYLSYYFQEYSDSILYSVQVVSVFRLIFIPIFILLIVWHRTKWLKMLLI
jgi:hypothetical protein